MNRMIPEIKISDYSYVLDEKRIAKYPLPERDASKLLVYKDGIVQESVFRNLPDYIPSGSRIVFNETKVVPARLHFQRESGAHIEIFCLEPSDPCEYNLSFAARNTCSWKCVIGNAKRWKGDIISLINPESSTEISVMNLTAELISRDDQTGLVRFRWSADIPFSTVLERAGTIPIPPYLNRESEEIDRERYQTLYARVRGSVAAPTAGLHFTERVLSGLDRKGVVSGKVCLHVGAGTFLPVKSAEISGHPMHREPFSVSLDFLKSLIDDPRPLTAVGTTSVRTLESLYYVGAKYLESGRIEDVTQWEPYEREWKCSVRDSLGALVEYLESSGLDTLETGTRIIIVPGFRFRMTDCLVTNFHQSCSTLLLLISAFVGGDWRTIYDYAVSNDFRFLSYGDSSLLFRVG